MSEIQKRRAVGYLRTSSAANVGAGKDGERRQRQAIEDYARSASLEIAAWYYDEAVSGADPVNSRPGFTAMMRDVAGLGVRTIVVETASRFARDLMVQEVGFQELRKLGFTLIAADSPSNFSDDTPTAQFVRQVLGAVAQFEKAMLVAKLKGARDRKRQEGGAVVAAADGAAEGVQRRKTTDGRPKVEGRKSHAEARPEVVAMAKRLHRYPSKGRRRSLREIATELAKAGHMGRDGKAFAAMSVKRMLEA